MRRIVAGSGTGLVCDVEVLGKLTDHRHEQLVFGSLDRGKLGIRHKTRVLFALGVFNRTVLPSLPLFLG